MMISYFKISLRVISGQKYYFILNVVGLVIGITCFVTLSLLVRSEMSYDTFFSDSDRLYRITTYFKRGDQEVKWAITNGGLVNLLKEKVSGVEDATMCFLEQSNLTFQIGDRSYAIPERTGFYVEDNFLSILDFAVDSGVDSTMLSEPNSIVLTAPFANKLFNRPAILGETIVIKSLFQNLNVKITGVLHDIPENSHMQFDYLISGKTTPMWEQLKDPKRGGFPVYVYFDAAKGATDSLLTKVISLATGPVYGETMNFPIMRVLDIHFNADNLFEHAKRGNYDFIRILSVISFLVLTIAVINYIILSTSQSARRVKEIGIRKSLGVSQGKLIFRFVTESVLVCMIAGALSLLLIELIFRSIFPFWFDTHLNVFNHIEILPLILGLSVVIGVCSGIFPAWQVTKLSAIGILRSQYRVASTSRFSLVSLMVTVQFVFAIVVIAGSIVVSRQLYFLKNKDLGFRKELVINVTKAVDVDRSQWNYFKELIQKESSIRMISGTLYKFISDYNATAIRVIDEETSDTLSLRVQWNSIDANLVPTLDLRIVEGRNFSQNVSSDSTGILINEAAARELGLASASDKKVIMGFFRGTTGRILGVVQDFHFQSFDKKVLPIAFIPHIRGFGGDANLLVRLQSNNIPASLKVLESRWKESGIGAPFVYTFLDDWFEVMIKKETQLSGMVVVFASLSIIISVLGLLGLVGFTAEQGKKEAAIRKVFGGSTYHIVWRMNRYFVVLILIAFTTAFPLSAWATTQWLQNFAYKIQVSTIDYVLTGLVFLIPVVIAIVAQSWQTANGNPANVLRQE